MLTAMIGFSLPPKSCEAWKGLAVKEVTYVEDFQTESIDIVFADHQGAHCDVQWHSEIALRLVLLDEQIVDLFDLGCLKGKESRLQDELLR